MRRQTERQPVAPWRRLAAAFLPALLACGLSAPASANPLLGGSGDSLASDDSLASRVAELSDLLASGEGLETWSLRDNLACVGVWEQTSYCPLWGWEEALPSVEDRLSLGAGDESTAVREQVELLRDDLTEAIEATGKVLADNAVIGIPAPSREELSNIPGAPEYLAGIDLRAELARFGSVLTFGLFMPERG